MAISLRLSDEDERLIKEYAQINKMTVSEFARNAMLEKIEDEYDLECYYKAMKEIEKDPRTYTFEEIKEELGL